MRIEESHVVSWWRQCLKSGRPVLDDRNWVEMATYRPLAEDPHSTWPRAVRRGSLYMDFLTWFDSNVASSRLIADQSMMFWKLFGPLLYIASKGSQTRRYKVLEQRLTVDGEWVTATGSANFVRLCPLPAHVAAFEIKTGVQVGLGEQKNDKVLEKSVNQYLKEVEEARERMFRYINNGGK